MVPKIIDLFSGCGGLTLGFRKAGFEIAAGIELMPAAHSTISYNLSQRFGRESSHICGDITKIDSDIFKETVQKEGCLVIGGPPCQAYSLVGRGKLKSLGKDRINTNDSRGYLFQDFLSYVYALNAKAVVMENVPESISFGKMNVPQIVCSDLEKHGYNAYWTILNSADFGVPQLRERLFVIAVRRDLGIEIYLPLPTHNDIKNQFVSTRGSIDRLSKFSFFKAPLTNDCAPNWVSVGDAISDLPSLHKNADDKYRNFELSVALPYKTEAQNSYQKLMRCWGGEERRYVTGNGYRNNPRDFSIFASMKEGDNYVNAHEIAELLFSQQISMLGYTSEDEQYHKLYKKMVPCYDVNKFLDKWKRLSSDKPSHTIVAHLSVDTYSHIHPWEPRGISVREAARLQSFPDDFLFTCSMGDAFKQIGNAVPPLLSYAIAKNIYKSFNGE